ncbi:protein DMR6-LIKE OXYGENASE 2 [Ziziphus jujuba]|uniref:Protein DMR6-LIKE OXYGENASE 2 n=1 Tax=Ziziphus jujuba TaxID=326968 RepID=A0A6P4AWF4_ZIZJJ|nr:protein DMR6-LIKE OXYGENASE 2 [Ziziphus jujuba]
MGEVDPAFVLEPEHRPKLSITEAKSIPVIDLSPVVNSSGDGDTKAAAAVVREIGKACEEWGFFQVINHGIPLEKREKAFAASADFFAQSLEEKRKVKRDESLSCGYYDTELTKNVRDWKEVFDFQLQDPTIVYASPDPDDKKVIQWNNQWPQNPPHFREACEEYSREVEKLSFRLTELIALSLGLPAKRLNEHFNDQTSFLRLNHYPPCPFPELALGVGRHKDGGALTVVAEDQVGGLEVKRKSDGEWVRIKPTPNAYIINVGDTMQVWSNERYQSVEHRAMVNSEKERFSIPFFFHPAHYTVVKPLEELIDEQNPPKYKPFSWGKFLAHRKLTNYKKLNVENLQISQFRIQD